MATKKSSSTRRKPGASKAPRKRKRVSGTTPATMSIAGVRFKKSTCHKTKSDAQKSAEAKRSKGQRARVIKSGTGYCVYSRGRARS